MCDVLDDMLRIKGRERRELDKKMLRLIVFKILDV